MNFGSQPLAAEELEMIYRLMKEGMNILLYGTLYVICLRKWVYFFKRQQRYALNFYLVFPSCWNIGAI